MERRGRGGAVDPDFETLLAAAQAGAPWACTTIWVQYAPSVAAFANARGSREPDDLTSEVFLALFDQLDRFVGAESEFRSFIFSIAYRRLVDELRMRSRRGVTVEWDDSADRRKADSAETEAIRRIDDDAALGMLDSLAPDQRDVMTLRIIADLTIDEIAAVLGKRPGAVKALQRRALESLRKKFTLTRTPAGSSSDSGK